MSINGLLSCARFAYPPNSLSLCGPLNKKNYLKWYTATGQIDTGAKEILSVFSTLYPYLSLIAHENNIKDPFDKRVVEAYWLGNSLLNKIDIKKFAHHLKDGLQLKKKITGKNLGQLLTKLSYRALPNHAFHVFNVYKRTGNNESLHTLGTMDACLINWGRVEKIFPNSLLIKTKPLCFSGNKIAWGGPIQRTVSIEARDEIIQPDDWITYHWGMYCQILTQAQLKNLVYYTNLSLSLANTDQDRHNALENLPRRQAGMF